MQINPGAAEFPHRQIADQLKARVRRGDWAPGERLPSIPAIAEMFGVAKQTVQRAVDQLRVEGILITKPGSGTYVRGTRRRLNRLSRGRYGGFRGYHADLAARYRQHLVGVGRAPAPPEVADVFGVPDGTELLVRRHLVRTEDTPVEVGASWFLPTDTAGTSLERAEAFGRPLYQEAEEATGRRYVTATDTISARQPSREEAETLQIRPDTPVLHLLHVAYDAARKPIEVAQATWPGPMTTLTEEYKVPGPTPDPDPDPGLVLG
ncbi:transcriptional regulator, GntR family [Micromonospora pallida]|uniref:Transcriptional regulator, GntR family n=1 Tax=Micromonospora pallida TaxID=145854 RepID=A0A1C6RYP9_9ACTN|nr:GntR family transcriptional regulator [Micromonospora pallida]SCL22330.1 transcriptional regulator, GntR family [Micromonospora pallida]